MMKHRRLSALCILLPLFALAAEERGNYRIESSGAVEWATMELSATIALNLREAGIRLPAGRTRAEEIIRQEYAVLMRPYILAIPVDSSTVLGDLIERGEISFFSPEEAAAAARRRAPALSADLSRLEASYTIDLSLLSAHLVRHEHAQEISRILTPVPAASYTGLIIIATGELPVHGKNTAALAEPCLFPKIWDTRMNLIYERNMLDRDTTARTMVSYAEEKSIFYPAPSTLSPELEAVVGPRPLRIMARGLFGARPTDPVIDEEDALIILSSENNRNLLREGKVVIILNTTRITQHF